MVLERGRRRLSIVRSAELLKEEMRCNLGLLKFPAALLKMNSRIMEIIGVIPLPPLISTKESNLDKGLETGP